MAGDVWVGCTQGTVSREMGKCLTETGVFREVSEELLALLLHVAAAFAGAPGRDGDAGGAGVDVVGRHVEACSQVKRRRGMRGCSGRDPSHSDSLALTNEPRVGAQARLVVVPGAACQGLEGGLAVGVEIGQPGSGCKE